MARDPEEEQVRQQLNALVGAPALLPEEDAAKYDELAEEIEFQLAPKNALERMFVRDIVQLIWDAMRLREYKIKMISSSGHEGLGRLLAARGIADNTRLCQGWARRDPKIMREVKSILEKFGLDEFSVSAETFLAHIESFDRIDAMISRIEARRNALFRELARYSEEVRQAYERKLAARAKQVPARPEPS